MEAGVRVGTSAGSLVKIGVWQGAVQERGTYRRTSAWHKEPGPGRPPRRLRLLGGIGLAALAWRRRLVLCHLLDVLLGCLPAGRQGQRGRCRHSS